ncbi:MAG: hypothetical protein AB7F78_04910 [Hyphomicrobiaceae bacterium]
MTDSLEMRTGRGLPDAMDRAGTGPTMLERGDFDVERALERKPRKVRIRCPHCRWQPGRGSTWTCLPIGHPEYFRDACGHSWNTFDTRGVCPGCKHQWLHTSCLSCGRWALHEAWYEREGPGPGAGPR